MKAFARAVSRFACVSALAICSAVAHADPGGQFYGLLRSRDLTLFGSLRLDMRPAHAVAIEQGSFALTTEMGYQNTWALSEEVERWLTEQEANGRRELGPADFEAIQDLPGENYLLDLEAAHVDVSVHYKFASNVSAYLIVSGIFYDGGFLDSTIESFHDTFGFSTFGRPAVSRNDTNLICDLKSGQRAVFDEPRSGLADPTLGPRYASRKRPVHCNSGIEGAAKI